MIPCGIRKGTCGIWGENGLGYRLRRCTKYIVGFSNNPNIRIKSS